MIVKKMQTLGEKRSVIRETFEYGNKRKKEIGEDHVFDFSLGNPSVPAPREVSDTLKKLIDTVPPEKLHAYTSAAGDMGVREKIAKDIEERFSVPADPRLFYMTAGAAASLSACLSALCQKGEEVAVIAPFFPEYKVFVENAGGILQVIPGRKGDFQIDEELLSEGIHENTAALIINSPNNPTGAVLTEESLNKISRVLQKKQEEYQHPIYLISDEPYRELSFDVRVPFVTAFYDNTLVCYSFSKSLSLPGERIGYIMVSPKMQDAKAVYAAVCGAGRSLGYVCAPSMMQFMAKECVGKTSDLSVYRENRSLLYHGLTQMGFDCVHPDGAFYLFMKSPEEDAKKFCEKAREYEILLVAGDDFGGPGYVRIAYCVSTEVIKKSLPAFEKLAKAYGLKARTEK